MQYTETEFETLYIECFPSALKLALSLLHEEDEARDVVHEVFLKLWESDTPIDHPKAYIIRLVRNASIDRIRKLDIRERIRQKLLLEPPPEDFDIDQRNEEVIYAIRNVLSSREREVVEKIYSDGLSYKDTAASLGVSVSAVNKNIVGALKKLRTHFKTTL